MDKKYFRIEGNAVHLISERIERTVTLADLMQEAVKEKGLVTPLLPLGCRFFSQSQDRSVFVIEQAPATRTIDWRNLDDGDRWKLAFPYVIFIIVMRGQAISGGECRIFYRTAPLGNGDDRVLISNLCNVNSNGTICTGNMRVEGASLAQKAESFVAAFWRSHFNSDLMNFCWTPASNNFPQVSSLRQWQIESAKNPLFPLGIQWFEAGILTDAIEGRL